MPDRRGPLVNGKRKGASTQPPPRQRVRHPFHGPDGRAGMKLPRRGGLLLPRPEGRRHRAAMAEWRVGWADPKRAKRAGDERLGQRPVGMGRQECVSGVRVGSGVLGAGR